MCAVDLGRVVPINLITKGAFIISRVRTSDLVRCHKRPVCPNNLYTVTYDLAELINKPRHATDPLLGAHQQMASSWKRGAGRTKFAARFTKNWQLKGVEFHSQRFIRDLLY